MKLSRYTAIAGIAPHWDVQTHLASRHKSPPVYEQADTLAKLYPAACFVSAEAIDHFTARCGNISQPDRGGKPARNDQKGQNPVHGLA
ncbi:hypothetical protein [Aliiroseovarius sp. 2305UL8-7]|uniref:hypothetical protein n=1 Tax=Aliiroseovarius conchicola TaxID=3121637 RepID=UPI003526EFCF